MNADGFGATIKLFVGFGVIVIDGSVERQFSSYSLEEHRAETPHVGRGSHSRSPDLFGRHVIERAHSLPALSRRAGNAEVEYLRQPSLGYDVGRLEVQMEDVVPVQVVESRAEMQTEMRDIRERETPGTRVDEVRECLPVRVSRIRAGRGSLTIS